MPNFDDFFDDFDDLPPDELRLLRYHYDRVVAKIHALDERIDAAIASLDHLVETDGIIAHWFTQGGESEFGAIAGENADELVASILRVVRARVGRLR